MMNKKEARKSINSAFNSLKQLTNIDLKLVELTATDTRREQSDARVILCAGGEDYEFFIEVRSEVRDLRHLWVKLLMKYHTEENIKGLLIIANYISPKVKEELNSKGVSYLEVSGNCLIQENGLFMFIDGQKTQQTRVKSTSKAVNNSGLKTILALLLKPSLLNASYRSIAKSANVSLGSIGLILNDLEDQGYIKIKKNKKYFINKTELVNRWLQLYPYTLKRKYYIGRYRIEEDGLILRNLGVGKYEDYFSKCHWNK